MVLYTLPVACVLVLCWLGVRRPVLDALGQTQPPARWSFPTAVWCLPSAIVGILTHIAWDRLTERGGWWDLVSLATMLVAAAWLAAWLWVRRRRGIRWPVLLGIGAAGLAAGVLAMLVKMHDGYGTHVALRNLVYVGALATGAAVVAWSLWWHASRLFARQSTSV